MAEEGQSVPQVEGVVANGLSNGVANGTSNGHSDSKDKQHKSSHKDKDRDRHSSSHKSSHKDKDKDRHKSSSSSSDKHKSSSSSSSGDKHKSSSSSSDKHKSSSSSDKHKSSSSSSSGDKHKSSSSSSSGDKHKSSSSSSSGDKHKSSSSSDKHKSSSSDKHRDKDKHKSSSSGDKHKERSDKDKERSEKDKERKDKERSDKDKDKSTKDKPDKHSSSSSSSSKDKHRSDKDRHRDDKKSSSSSSSKDRHHSSSKSSHKDKHRDKDRHREDKDRSSSHGVAAAPAAPVVEVAVADVLMVKEDQPSLQDETLLDTTADTTQESIAEHRAGEASADSEEDNKLLIDVKEEPVDTSALSNSSMSRAARETTQGVKYEADDDEDDDVPLTNRKVKKEESDEEYKADESDDDVPLGSRKKTKREESDEEDDIPLASRKKLKAEESGDDDEVPLAARRKSTATPKKKRKKAASDEEDDDDFKPKTKKAKVKKEKKAPTPKRASTAGATGRSPTKKVKKESEEEKNVWKWWEEEKKADGRKWTFLEHKGVVFADAYEILPNNVYMKYDGQPMPLCESSEEVAGFYARMLEHDYVTKDQFNKNFFKDFRKSMNEKERAKITDLKKCDFRKMYSWYASKSEERKNRTKEEKKAAKEVADELIKTNGWCIIDGHKQRIANFKAEPPGLFRGRGDHPKMGMLKTRILPRDVIINCSKDSTPPQAPDGHRWKEVRHDNQVTWLASWCENVQGQTKYVMMNAASKLKGEKDWQKYETARRLHQIAHRIREKYKSDWKSKEMRIRQRSVALYFIDKLALRAGNEKDEDQADTVGCCSLRVEHITLFEEKDGKECVVAFDFLGKDSIRYYNEVPVEKRVFKNVHLFMENKAPADDLFDRLNTQIMNKHLNELMDGLTAKVFRTYNASRTLQEQLTKLTDEDDLIPSKVLSYNRANREVAILCNHQRAVPKTYDQSMANLQKKIDEKKDLIEDAEKDLKTLKRCAKSGGSMAEKAAFDKKKKALDRLNDQLSKLEILSTDKEENKQIALGTSKLNYLDPRISVAWCKRNEVPIEKVYNKTQRLKFQWALEMATDDFDFLAAPTSTPRPADNSMADDNEDQDEDMD